MEFTHLHVHSHYSLLDGAIQVKPLIDATLKHGMTALALTDHGNMFGAMEFYREAKAAGLKPIPGIEAYVSPTTRQDRSMGNIETAAYHILLLAMNEKGWQNLLKLSSSSFLEGFYYRPRVDRELLARHNEGIVCATACLGGEVPTALMRGEEDVARRIAGEYLDIFGPDRFFIELQNQGYKEQEQINPSLTKLAKHLGVGLVGTNDVHFLRREDKPTHEVLTCIATAKKLTDEKKPFYSTELYLKSPAEMCEALAEWPEAITNTLRIAEMCECTLDYSEKKLPVFETPQKEPAGEYLATLARDGLKKRFDGSEPPQEYRDRLKFELKVIDDKGYSSYFLIINDCVQFARKDNIPTAPRGSGVATLMGYALGIADIDPIKYGLLFERFTDPEREEDPDIDLDICQDGRAKVIQYVREKYGHVAQIITYGTLKARAAIRDVGRVMDIPLSEVDVIAKLVPEGPGVTLDAALKSDAELRKRYESDPIIKTLIDHSRNLEGLARHSGVHAAGVVVSDRPLDDFLPLCKQSNSDGVITQWDGVTCLEDVGLMKMDFLGLRTLSIIRRARELVREHTGKDVDPEKIPLNDQDVFDLFKNGDTDGVFQFESEGMKAVLNQMKPNRIEDLIAANAMYRPGPMALIPTYCLRKHEKEDVPAVHPLVDEMLAETYGVMAYQEQVMQVLNRLGKIPLNTAYTLIKAISKRKNKVILREKPNFIRGAKENGIDQNEATKLFDLILEFGGYGFNKAHSTRYAIVAYQTAYFKVHHPKEFFAATLTYESVNRDKVVQYMAEAARMDIAIASPDISTCGSDFAVDGDSVRFGLAAVKGVGSKAVHAIVKARDEVGRFRDLFHFCQSVDLRAVNRSTIDSLIRCGAFDSVADGHRAALLAVLDKALQAGQSAAADRRRGQFSLFENDDAAAEVAAPLPTVERWSNDLLLAAERDTLGFYVTSHPLAEHERTLDNLNWPRGFSLDSVSQQRDATPVAFGCIVEQIRTVLCKRGKSAGKKMAILTLADLSGKNEAVMFPETFAKFAELAQPDALLYVTGMVSHRNGRIGLVADSICPVQQAIPKTTQAITIRMPAAGANAELLETLRSALQLHKGECRVRVRLRPNGKDTTVVVIELDREWSVRPSAELVATLEELVGPRNLRLHPKKPRPTTEVRRNYRQPAGAN